MHKYYFHRRTRSGYHLQPGGGLEAKICIFKPVDFEKSQGQLAIWSLTGLSLMTGFAK